MSPNAFAAVAGSDLVATAPTRLAERPTPAFGLQMFMPPLAIDPIMIESARTNVSLGDPATDWLANRILATVGAIPPDGNHEAIPRRPCSA
jgi:hypothetical protein